MSIENPFNLPPHLVGMTQAKRDAMKLYGGKNGSVTFEKTFPSGLYVVTLRDTKGDVADKARCDDYRMAREHIRAFRKIAKA